MATMPIRLVIDNCREWGKPLHIMQLDISDAFEGIGYWCMCEATSKNVGKRRALTLECASCSGLPSMSIGPETPTTRKLAWGGEGSKAPPRCLPFGGLSESMPLARSGTVGLKEGGESWSRIGMA